jgi:YD repeat-containing protein
MKAILERWMLSVGCWIFAAAAALAFEPLPQERTGWQVISPSTSGNPPVILKQGSAPDADILPSWLFYDEFSMLLDENSQESMLLGAGILSSYLPVSTNSMISELARGLGTNWLSCYLFVRNNIKFTPYKGILRGPERTLIDREGNDADQALLLYALLRACGFSGEDTKICYSTAAYDQDFRMPLAGGTNDYDAAHWLGVPADGTVVDLTNAITKVLSPSGVLYGFSLGSTPQDSYLCVDHFCVVLQSDPLDPSFKPRKIRAASATLLSDMGYTRSNLLACAGGSVTNDWFVQGLSAEGLSDELCRMSAVLASAWRNADTNGISAAFVGSDEIVPQDLSTDDIYYHGISYYGYMSDWDSYEWYFSFFDKYDYEKNAYRYRMYVFLGDSYTNKFFLDELGPRTLWVSFTNAPGYTYPKAVLMLDGAELGYETAVSTTSPCTTYIDIYRPYGALGNGAWISGAYGLERGVTNYYVIPVGFGSDTPDGMREWTAREVARLKGRGVAEDAPALRVAVLHSLGQQWLYQCAAANTLYARLGGYQWHTFFDTGITGHERASYFDFKTGCSYTSEAADHFFSGGLIFNSALEHGVLDQANGPDRPSVSTVRVLRLNSSNAIPVLLVSSSNWQTVRSSMLNYTANDMGFLDGQVSLGQKLLLPQDGHLTLGLWSGTGFFSYGPVSLSSFLSGALGGGEPTTLGPTLAANVVMGNLRYYNQLASVQEILAADPVDMRSGSAVISRMDLALGGPFPLAWVRHYDSRRRGVGDAVGRGWSHSFDSRVTVHADPEGMTGRGSPAACAASAVAFSVVHDLMSAEETAQNFTVATLVADWWTEQLRTSGASVVADGNYLTYTRLPDGSYEPAPGVTASLSGSEEGGFTLQERLGRTWRYAASGMLESVHDSSGNGAGLIYAGGTNLVAVTNAFGGRLDLSRSGGRISSVSDSAGRSVSYAYSPDGCLTGVTDTAGYMWKLAYDEDGNFLSETDPSGTVTVLNTYNEFGQVTNQLSAAGDPWRFGYAAGWRSWEADPLLNRTHHGFTAEGRPVRRVEKDNGINDFAYDSRGHVVTNTDVLGRSTVMTYDASNRLSRVIEAANTPQARTNSFAYDARHRLAAVTNALGLVSRFTYDDADRLASVTLPEGSSVTNVWTANGLLASEKRLSPSGCVLRQTAYTHDPASGLPVTKTVTGTGIDAIRESYGWDAAGNLTLHTNANGHVTRFTYDSRGLLTNAVDAAGRPVSSAYTPEGRLHTVTDALGRTTIFRWTTSGELDSVTYRDGTVSTNEYDVLGNLAASSDPRALRVAFERDAMGRTIRRHTPVWEERFHYDAAGSVTARVDAASITTRTAYDWLDRATSQLDGLGREWHAAYDPLDRVTSSTDPRNRVNQGAYDSLGRLTASVRPSGATQRFGYDVFGNRTSFTNAQGHVYTMAYDALGRMTAATNALGAQAFRAQYDPVGNLTNRMDGEGVPVAFQYDALERLTLRSSASAEERFGYDAVGNLLTASNATARLAFGYDSMDRLIAATNTIQVSPATSFEFLISYKRDAGGLVTNIVYAAGKAVSRTYDDDGNLKSVKDWLGHEWTFGYNGMGQPTGGFSPGSFTHGFTYDGAGRLDGWSVSSIAGRTIERDTAGIRTRDTVTIGTMPTPSTNRKAVNAFDAADKLVSASVTYSTNAPLSETYGYDLHGSMTNIVSGTNLLFAASYTDFGQLSSLMHSRTNELMNFFYDANGNRVITGDKLWVTDHADPVKRPLIECSTNGVVQRYYLWGNGRLLGFIDSEGALTIAHSDEQGSVVALTASNGAVLHTAHYGPHGENWGTTGTNATPFAWLGGHGVLSSSCFTLSPSPFTLYLTRHRLYSATLKRFLSSDPLGLEGGLNLYAYGESDPLSYIDPLGLRGGPVDSDPIGSALSKITSIEAPANPLKPINDFLHNPSRETVDALMRDPAIQMGMMVAVGSVPKTPVGSLKLPTANWLKSKGVDPHVVKDGMSSGRMDVFVDAVGNVWAKGKGIADEFAEYLGNLSEFK